MNSPFREPSRARGLQYRLHDRTLPGTPDLVFRRFGAVCLVHGCFWHRHAACPYATTPSTREGFWRAIRCEHRTGPTQPTRTARRWVASRDVVGIRLAQAGCGGRRGTTGALAPRKLPGVRHESAHVTRAGLSPRTMTTMARSMPTGRRSTVHQCEHVTIAPQPVRPHLTTSSNGKTAANDTAFA